MSTPQVRLRKTFLRQFAQFAAFGSGVLLAILMLCLTLLIVGLPISPSSTGYLLGAALFSSGLILTPWNARASRLSLTGAMLMLTVVAGWRLLQVQRAPASALHLVTLPAGTSTRWLSYLLDEQDSLIFGESLFHRIGGDTVREHTGLTAALHVDYAELKANQPVFPSPFLNTYLSLQSPAAFDAVVIEAPDGQAAAFAVIFLHGYMGNVAAQCWEIAEAVRAAGGLTICPSTEWRGEWWQPEGLAILQETLRYARTRGLPHFYLGGFSNGGFGLGRLTPELQLETGLRGLLFIDGFAEGAAVRATGLPTLIVQGAQDERVSAARARQFAEAVGPLGTYVELEGDHFLIMKQPQQVQAVLTAWLNELESRQP